MSDITIVVDCNDADFARDICAALQQFPDVWRFCPITGRCATPSTPAAGSRTRSC